jgi:hypothetical protein
MQEFTHVDTSTGPITVTLPVSPAVGDCITFMDSKRTFSKNPLTIRGSIMNNPNNLVCNIDDCLISLVFDGSTWMIATSNCVVKDHLTESFDYYNSRSFDYYSFDTIALIGRAVVIIQKYRKPHLKNLN